MRSVAQAALAAGPTSCIFGADEPALARLRALAGSGPVLPPRRRDLRPRRAPARVLRARRVGGLPPRLRPRGVVQRDGPRGRGGGAVPTGSPSAARGDDGGLCPRRARRAPRFGGRTRRGELRRPPPRGGHPRRRARARPLERPLHEPAGYRTPGPARGRRPRGRGVQPARPGLRAPRVALRPFPRRNLHTFRGGGLRDQPPRGARVHGAAARRAPSARARLGRGALRPPPPHGIRGPSLDARALPHVPVRPPDREPAPRSPRRGPLLGVPVALGDAAGPPRGGADDRLVPVLRDGAPRRRPGDDEDGRARHPDRGNAGRGGRLLGDPRRLRSGFHGRGRAVRGAGTGRRRPRRLLLRVADPPRSRKDERVRGGLPAQPPLDGPAGSRRGSPLGVARRRARLEPGVLAARPRPGRVDPEDGALGTRAAPSPPVGRRPPGPIVDPVSVATGSPLVARLPSRVTATDPDAIIAPDALPKRRDPVGPGPRPERRLKAPGLLDSVAWRARRLLRGSAPVVFLSENPRYAAFDVGAYSYGEPEVVYWDAGARLKVGRFCSIARGVTILLGGEHHSEWVTTYPFSLVFADARSLPGYPHTKGDVVIGNDVWIGQDAVLLSGVTVGDGAVIGAGSVVARDVEPYSVCAGNPARQVRLRFPPETIAELLRIAWWDWPLDEVEKAWPLLQSADVAAFVGRYGRTPPTPR